MPSKKNAKGLEPSAHAAQSTLIEHMFVLGIDPGVSRCGYGVLEAGFDGGQGSVRAVGAGVFTTPPEMDLPMRLQEIYRDLTAVIKEYQPEVMAIEQVFTNRNLNTAVAVGRASGVAMLAAGQAGMSVFEISPSAVKLAVTGYGRAEKQQIRYAIMQQLKLKVLDAPADAADALALALSYVRSHRPNIPSGSFT